MTHEPSACDVTQRLSRCRNGFLLAAFYSLLMAVSPALGISPKAAGANSLGALGTGNTTSSSVAVDCNTSTHVVQMAGGASHSIARSASGAVFTWGYNAYGQLGDGGTTNGLSPVQRTGGALSGRTAVMVAAGETASFAVLDNGTVASWGRNDTGRLGTGNTTNRGTPGLVVGLGGSGTLGNIVTIDGDSAATAAVDTAGQVWTWGTNNVGQLGNGSTTNRFTPGTVPGITNAVSVAMGDDFCLVLLSDGTVKAWGRNTSGQIGDGSVTNRTSPVTVASLSGVAQIAAGGSHAVALKRDGTVWAWGENGNGQLGLGNTTDQDTPQQVTGLSNEVVEVAAGTAFTIVRRSNGTTRSFGLNTDGQLADGSTTQRTSPVVGYSGGNCTGIGTGKTHSLYISQHSTNTTPAVSTGVAAGITPTSAIVSAKVNPNGLENVVHAEYGPTTSYGSNTNGVTLSGSAIQPVSFALSGLSEGQMYHYRVVTTNGAVIVTGADQSFTTSTARLSSLTLSEGVLAPIFAGGTAGYATTVYGSTLSVTPTVEQAGATVKVNNVAVPSGTASAPASLSPGNNTITVVVTAADGVSTRSYTLTVDHPASLPATYSGASDVPVTASGFNATGTSLSFNLGFPPSAGTELMVVKNTGLGFITGQFSNLAQGQTVTLNHDGVRYHFVANYYGGTGNDLVLVWKDTKAWAWGYNVEGQIGDGTTTPASPFGKLVPTLVSSAGVLSGKIVIAIAAGIGHSLALCSDGTLAAWGDNTYGQLGNNSNAASFVPVAVDVTGVLAGKTVVAVAAGLYHSLALCSDGTVVAWGRNNVRQLGDSTTTDRSVPVTVHNAGVLAGKIVVAIAAGNSHNLALCADGALTAWGSNASGQLGNTNILSGTAVPVEVNSAGVLSGRIVTAIAAGAAHSLVLCADGALATWGGGGNGELGNNSFTGSAVPVLVNSAGMLSGKTVTAITTGAEHNLVLCSDGTLAAWGRNQYGQLGNNSGNTVFSVPVLVHSTGVLSGKRVTAIAGGLFHSLALCSDRTLTAWGYNGSGGLGNNSTTNSFVPVVASTAPLGNGQRWAAAASGASGQHSLALVAAPPMPDIEISISGVPAPDGGSASLGITPPGVPFARSLSLSNTGDMPLEVTGLTLTGAAFELIGTFTPISIPPGSGTTIQVRFLANGAPGIFTGGLIVTSNDPDAEGSYGLNLTAGVQVGVLDRSFNGTGMVVTNVNGTDEMIRAVMTQPDGKIVVAGFCNVGASQTICVARYLAGGSLDNSFDGDGRAVVITAGAYDEAYDLAIQPDGKILVAGRAAADFCLARLDHNGALDTTFGNGGYVTTDFSSDYDEGRSLALQADGRIVVGGFTFNGTKRCFALARYTSSGALDTAFGSGGKVVTSIGLRDEGRSVALQPDGRIVLSGFARIGSNFDFALARYTSTGELDLTFDSDGIVTTAIGSFNEVGESVAVQTDGKIVVAGYSNNGLDNDFALVRYTTAGSLDPSFGSNGKVTTAIGSIHDEGRSLAMLGDGKMLVGGHTQNEFNHDFALVRYTSGGALDTTFGNGGKITTPIGSGDDAGQSLAVQTDGKIILAGYAHNGSNYDFALSRYGVEILNTVTTAAAHSVTSSSAVLNGTVNPMGVTTSAWFEYGPTISYGGSTGSQALGHGTSTIPVTATLTGLSSNTSYHYRMVAQNGTSTAYGQDQTFTTPPTPPDIAVSLHGVPVSDGGNFSLGTTPLGSPLTRSVMISNTGEEVLEVASLTLSGSAFEFVGGSFSPFSLAPGASSSAFQVRFLANTVPGLFSSGLSVTSNDPDEEGTFTVALSARATVGGNLGVLDTTFNGTGKVITPFGTGNAQGQSVVVQSDGKIIMAGHCMVGSNPDFALVRYMPDGSLDPGFGTGGKVITPVAIGSDSGNSVALQNDGKIVVVGTADFVTYQQFAIVRYMTDGALDMSFGTGGKVTAGIFGSSGAASVAIQSDGKIVVAGTAAGTGGTVFNSHFGLMRFLTDGTLDTTFGSGGIVSTPFYSDLVTPGSSRASATSMKLQNDGKIIVAGTADVYEYSDFAVARYLPNGMLDTSFGTGGLVATPVGMTYDYGHDVEVQSDGKIIVAGYTQQGGNGGPCIALVRYQANAALDTSFGTGGKVITDVGFLRGMGKGLVLQGDGKIVVGGTAFNSNNDDFAVVRYTSSGALDTNFGIGGKVVGTGGGYGQSVALQPDGRIVVTGYTAMDNGSYGFAVTRFGADLRPTVTTIAASSSVLNGTVNPNGVITSAWFEYGLTTDYEHSTAPQALGHGTSAAPVTASLTGLMPGSIYHFRLVAQNGTSMAYGADMILTPLNTNASLASLTTTIGVLSPAFNPSTTDYTLTLPRSGGSGALTPTTADSNASVSVNGTPVAAGQSHTFNIGLGGGALTSVAVTASDGVTVKLYNIQIRSNAPPILTMPASPLVAEATSASGAHVNFTVSATDSEDGPLAPTTTYLSGSLFPRGDTVVNAQVFDSMSEQTTGSFIVRVRDTTAPVIIPPASMIVAATSAAGAVVAHPAATVTDAVSLPTVSYSANGGPPSPYSPGGTTFPIGLNVVTITARDDANNTSTHTFTITVVDSQVSVLGLTKTRFHNQTAAATTSAADFSMSAFIEGRMLSSGFPASSNRFDPAGGSTTNLAFDSEDSAWRYEQRFATQSAMNASYPNGAYNFRVGASPVVSLSFPGTSYPNVPVINASAGTWSGGKLLLTPAEAAAGITLTSNVSNGDGFLTLEVFSDTEDILHEEVTENPDLNESLSGSIPGGSLAVGQTYEVYAEFDKVASSTPLAGQSWAQAGAAGYALFSSSTFFELRVMSAQEHWRLQNFGNIANSDNAADGADPDNDGLSNFLEWACGLSPTAASTQPVTGTRNGGSFEFTYARGTAAVNAGTVFIVEWSDMLLTNGWSSAGVTQQVLSDNGTLQQVRATLPAGSNGRRFARLKVSPP